MPKTPTQWQSNADKYDTLTTYSSSSVTYSSSAVAYSNPDTALDEQGRSPQLWAVVSKQATDWSGNASAESADIYDPSTTTYETIYSYFDGNQDTTQSPVQSKLATVWSEA